MKAKINIEFWDSITQEEMAATGFTNETIKNLYEVAFRNILDKMNAAGACNYSLSVEVVEE